jgi:hypothetical protein
MSNLIHIYLDRVGLPITHHRGTAQPLGSYPVDHDWLKLGPWTIDYRLRIWYPDAPKATVPNGIFRANDFKVTYYSEEFPPLLPLTVIPQLERSRPAPDWSIYAKVYQNRFEGKSQDGIRAAVETEINRAPPTRAQMTDPKLN